MAPARTFDKPFHPAGETYECSARLLQDGTWNLLCWPFTRGNKAV